MKRATARRLIVAAIMLAFSLVAKPAAAQCSWYQPEDIAHVTNTDLGRAASALAALYIPEAEMTAQVESRIQRVVIERFDADPRARAVVERDPQLPALTIQTASAVIAECMPDHLTIMQADAALIFARSMSVAQLNAAADFYRSESGQAILQQILASGPRLNVGANAAGGANITLADMRAMLAQAGPRVYADLPQRHRQALINFMQTAAGRAFVSNQTPLQQMLLLRTNAFNAGLVPRLSAAMAELATNRPVR